jgi:EF-hand domain-containing protein 1
MRTQPPVSFQQTREKPQNDYIPRIQPSWLKYDRKVLRFFCYFQESVVESQLENYRVRPCILYYYLNDDTIHLTEPRVVNSGITQGIFINRQRVPKEVGGTDYFLWQDFGVQINMNLFERMFRVYDCDDFTRKFYEDMEQPLEASESLPSDNF